MHFPVGCRDPGENGRVPANAAHRTGPKVSSPTLGREPRDIDDDGRDVRDFAGVDSQEMRS
jgi:hypothetical protein